MDLAAIERRVREHVDAGHVVGLSLAVVEGDAVVHAAGYGRTSVEDEGVPVTPDTLFDLGSISKTFVAALVMRLVEAGKLDLDRPVEGYVEGFAFDDRAWGPRVTLRHLLSHTAGLPGAGKDWGPGDPDALRDFMREQLAHYRFFAPPGLIHHYSNTAICLAGAVAEAVTGRTYRELVQAEVFDPLGMERTTFDRTIAMTRRLALPHEEDEDGRVRTLHRWTDNRAGEPSSFAIGSALDLANLGRMHLNRGRVGAERYLSEESVETMHRQHGDRRIRGASHPFAHVYTGYGLSMVTGTYRGARIRRHGGLSQSFQCYFDLFPDRGRGFVLLANHADEGRIGELALFLYDQVLGLDPADPVVPLPPAGEPDRAAWPRHEGTYLHVQGTRMTTVRQRGGRLTLDGDELTPLGGDEYVRVGEGGLREPVAFLAESGSSTEYVVLGGQLFRRFEGLGAAPDPATWERLVGEYVDPSNLGDGASLRFELRGGRPWLAGDWADEELRPIGPTRFLSSIGSIELDHDAGVLTRAGATRNYRVGRG